MDRLFTVTQYADYRKKYGLPGGTRQAVHKAIKSGRISLTADGLIDPKIADKLWALRTTMKMPTIG